MLTNRPIQLVHDFVHDPNALLIGTQRLARRSFNEACTVAFLSPSNDASFLWLYGIICDARSSHMREAATTSEGEVPGA